MASPQIYNPVRYRTIQVAGGDLFTIAARELGDASQWNRIASLNGMVDPFFSELLTLKIPPIGNGNGGIWGQ